MTLKQLFTQIANNIRAKKGTVSHIVATDFPTEIASIPDDLTPSLAQDTVTVIKEEHFKDCTKIRNYMFAYCTNLETIRLPYGITEIGSFAFANCIKLFDITFPSNLTKIGDDAFINCTNLDTLLTIPSSVTEIGFSAFSGCTSITTVLLYDNITKIKGYTFSGCTSLKNIILPETVTEIGDNAFGGCTALDYMYLREGLTTIGKNAFKRSGLTQRVTIPSTVTSMDVTAFNYTNIESLVIPESVHFTVTGLDNILEGCTKITEVDLPSTYGENEDTYKISLYDNHELNDLTLRANRVIKTYINSINSTKLNTGYLRVPANLVDSYKADPEWSTIAERIVAITD